MNDSLLSTRKLVAEMLGKTKPTVTMTDDGKYKLTVIVDETTIEGIGFMMETAVLNLKINYDKHVNQWFETAISSQNDGIS